MALLRWLTFLLGSLTVTPQSCSFVFLSSDASICSTIAFPLLRNSDYVVASVSIDFLSNSKRDAQFHIPYLVTIIVLIGMVFVIV